MKLSIATSLLLALAAPALADEPVPCKALSELEHPGDYRRLTRDEWQAARMLFFTAKDTPAQLPPGDEAMIRSLPDGGAVLVFVDGDEVCAPLHTTGTVVEILKQVRDGTIAHPAGRM